eukprot:TRINITY_DN23649_c0_g1_i1.p1 TRINITY_DN23649_c0_g1~~TRINITY_DN23649_c0_g1_i1.p1  ORF type:complete len:372 (+),score=95.77 TRINITY_DN23649_c0_g1_i1:151-1266(+)
MASEAEKSGHAKFVDEDYEGAVDLYSEAIGEQPNNAGLYVSRAAAHIHLEAFTEAVADANKAIELDPSLPKAYLRKGIACFSLEEFETAQAAFETGARLEPSNSSFRSWINKCQAKILAESGGAPNGVSHNGHATPALPPQNGDEDHTAMEVQSSAPAAEVPASVPAPPRFRHEYYQSPSHVVVTIFAKGIKQEDLTVNIGPQILHATIKIADGDDYFLNLRLFGKVDPAASNTTVMGTKIEVRLKKVDAIQWTSLEYTPTVVLQPINVSDEKAVDVKKKYPSSSKANRDWDKLEAEVKKEEKNENLEGDAALNKLFQDIYKNADEDTRRAMNKSFVESNGTTLSTNWKEVGVKTIEGQAPSGMEMHKWTE